jgi:hypothetical protein
LIARIDELNKNVQKLAVKGVTPKSGLKTAAKSAPKNAAKVGVKAAPKPVVKTVVKRAAPRKTATV